MQCHVGGRALNHPQQGVPGRSRDGTGLTGDKQADTGQVLRRRFEEGIREGRRFQPGGSQFVDQAAGVRKVLAQHGGGRPDILTRGGTGPGTVGGLEEENAAGQALRHGVVDFPGNPLPLLNAARLALGGRQMFLGQGNRGMQAALFGSVIFNAVEINVRMTPTARGPRKHRHIAAAAEPEQSQRR